MKTATLFDFLFIIATTLVILPLVEFGYSEIISTYSVVFIMAAYYIGKYSKGLEIKKESKTRSVTNSQL